MPQALRNNTQGARRIGEITIAPGEVGVIVDDSWNKNPVVKEWVDSGQLSKVAMKDVDKANASSAEDIAKAEAEAQEALKQKAKDDQAAAAEQAENARKAAAAAANGSPPPPPAK